MAITILPREVYTMDCIQGMKLLRSKSINILYTDPPYNMDSMYYIDSQGHYVFQGQGKDFMGKWDAMDGRWWEAYFKEAFRILKFGGYVIMHNIDRQSDLWTYYARRTGFIPRQKLYWLFISNFPKAVDAALMIDKKLRVKREVAYVDKAYISSGSGVYNYNSEEMREKQMQKMQDIRGGNYNSLEKRPILEREVTVATSELAKKYDGYKYGQADLKQILEEILVFQRPCRDGTITDLLSYEKRNDLKIHPAVHNLKETKVEAVKRVGKAIKEEKHTPQLIVSADCAPFVRGNLSDITDTMGLSEAFTKIEYLDDDIIPYIYEPKVSKSEKDEGLQGLEEVLNAKANVGTLLNEKGKDKWATKSKNPHPTPKPLNLCKHVLTLFKPPVPITVLDTFAGQGSIPKACEEMDIEWYAFELKPEFAEIARLKIKSAKQDLFGGTYV